MQVSYLAPIQISADRNRHFATVEIIDESECRNKWRINPAGKARALAGLFQTPLLGPPGLAHVAIDTVGRPVSFESNFSTHVLYEITNPFAWPKIQSGEWRAVSPQLTFLNAHREGDTLVIDDYRFDHVAFVERGAFPNAGVKSTCEGDPALCGFSNAVNAAFHVGLLPTVGDLVEPGLPSRLAASWRGGVGDLTDVPWGREAARVSANRRTTAHQTTGQCRLG
jgi:hypothetical protein